MMPRATFVTAALVALLLPAAGGCYTYSGVEGGASEPGSQVRLRLTEAGVEMVREQTGRSFGPRVRGRLLESSGDSTSVRVAQSTREPTLRGGSARPGVRYHRIGVPDSVVEAVEVRRLSLWRTGALVAGAGLGLRLFLELPEVLGGGGSGPVDTQPPSQPARRPPR